MTLKHRSRRLCAYFPAEEVGRCFSRVGESENSETTVGVGCGYAGIDSDYEAA